MIKSFVRKTRLFLSVAMVASMPAIADDTRFTLEEFGSGYIILNSQSDIVSTCSKIDAGFSCKFEGKGPLFLSNRVLELERLVEELEAKLDATKSAAAAPETAQIETAQAEKTQIETVPDESTAGSTPPNLTPATEQENNNQLVSPETRNQIMSFSSTLFDRLFEFVDLVKRQTSS